MRIPTTMLIMAALLLVAQPAAVAFGQEENEPAEQQTLLPTPAAPAATGTLKKNRAQITATEDELKQLDEKINQLKAGYATAADQAGLAAGKVAKLNKELALAELQFEQTTLTISETNRAVEQTTAGIAAAEENISEAREQLGEILRALYEHDQTTLIDIVLGSGSLSSVLSDRRTYQELQQHALDLISALKEKQRILTTRREELAEQQRQLEQLKTAQAYQQAEVAERRGDQQELLSRKQEEQAQYQQRIAEAQQARQEIERKIFSLRSAGIEVTLNDAFTAARYASSRTGVRPALLLAILKVETNVGENLGGGVFPNDMHPASREPFLRLMKKLGRDPLATPLSRRPTSYQGWGGAIGPGQFMPQTWELLEPRIGQLTGKEIPDPFVLSDALVATGIMLADRGAADPNKEVEATARFLAGPNWLYHLWYSRRVLAVANEYVQEGLI